MGVLSRISVGRKLIGIAWIGAAITCVVGVVAFRALNEIQAAGDRAAAAADVAALAAHEGATLQDIRATAYGALGSTFVPGRDGVQLERTMEAAVTDLRETQRELAIDLRGVGMSESAVELPGGSAFLQQASLLAQARARGATVRRADVVSFETLAGSIATQILANQAILGQRASRARVDADRVEHSARIQLLIAIGIAVVLLVGLCSLLARSILRRLKEMRTTAEQLTGGDLDARITVRGNDELAVLGNALNETADSVKSLLARVEADSERDGFARELASALEMADSETDVHEVVQRAMADVNAELPMELLLADSSRAHLERAVANPGATPPGCPVDQPYSCVAVRRAQAVVFPTSEALSSCPKLRDRGDGELSACCVPVSFMGRSLGVLHATAPAGSEWSSEDLERLGTLASQAGTRIGTVRSVVRTQLQAATDGLTGLLNRRSIETRARRLVTGRTPFTVVLADLDRFKVLNDTFGHEAGDRALKMFAGLMRAQVRDNDLIGRLGGEEFVLVLPGTPPDSAPVLLERLRAELAAALVGNPPVFTASFGVAGSEAGESFDEILRVADAALYRAKDEGRDRIVVAAAEDEARVRLKAPDGAANRNGAGALSPDDDRDPFDPVALLNGSAAQHVPGDDDPMDDLLP